MFCRSWHFTAVKDSDGNVVPLLHNALFGGSQKKAGEEFDTIPPKVHYTKPSEGDNIEVLLSDCQVSQNFQPDAAVEKFITE